jgi:predicted Zn-dependent protease
METRQNSHASKGPRWRRLGSALLAAAMLAACATNPVTGKQELSFVSEAEEIGIGAKQYQPTQQSSGGRYLLDPALTAYVNEVGQKLARVSERSRLPYEFVVINDSTPNAWALPGGKLAINRGLLTELKSEAELAAVLGHEIVHAAARHGARSVEQGTLLSVGAAIISILGADTRHADLIDFAAQGGAALIGLRYGREHELEADHYGIEYMKRAGYDPQAAVELQETLLRLSGNKAPGWLEGILSTHPPTQERVDANRRYASLHPGSFVRGEEEYRRRIAGLIGVKPAYQAHDAGRKLLDKEPQKALEKADEALAIEPREALFHALKGDALKKLGRAAEAEREYDEALKRNGEYFAHYLGRGQLRDGRGDRAGARADFEQANRLLPTAVAHYGLGRIAQAANDSERAMAHYREAAGSDSEIGRRAGAALVRLDLPRNPSGWVRVEPQVDGSGNFVLRVTNRAPIALRNLRLVGAVAGAGFQREFNLAGLRPGQGTVVGTGYRLPENRTGLQLRAQVRSAEAAE